MFNYRNTEEIWFGKSWEICGKATAYTDYNPDNVVVIFVNHSHATL